MLTIHDSSSGVTMTIDKPLNVLLSSLRLIRSPYRTKSSTAGVFGHRLSMYYRAFKQGQWASGVPIERSRCLKELRRLVGTAPEGLSTATKQRLATVISDLELE